MTESIADAARSGSISKVSSRGRTTSIRFGIDSVLRSDADLPAGSWLTVRRVYEHRDVHYWTTGLSRNSDRFCSRTRSARKIESTVRSMCQGYTHGGGRSYVEVLAWREDKNYPEPRPVREVLEELHAR